VRVSCTDHRRGPTLTRGKEQRRAHGAATPCALYALGASLTRYSLGSNLREPALLVALKMMAQPLLMWLLFLLRP
jgi:predicted permease